MFTTLYFYDYIGFGLMLLSLIITLWAQLKMQSTFKKYSQIRNSRGMTGADVARMILDRNGLHHVRVERVAGHLSDHFDPRANVVRLSQSVYDSQSVAAIGVAAHETGHAIQYAQNYKPMEVRASIIPATQFGSMLSTPLIILGFFMGMQPLVYAGIICFCLVALFQLVTLPVEFNASRRAMETLAGNYILNDQELKGTKKVLTAAAMTYVAALLASLLQILRFLLIARRRD